MLINGPIGYIYNVMCNYFSALFAGCSLFCFRQLIDMKRYLLGRILKVQ